ncbi:TPA: hypothetical protein QDB01_000302 [Burkholderia vietnamiensis]|nr:hypothetical protein [Burkholderia vietnamiensis]
MSKALDQITREFDAHTDEFVRVSSVRFLSAMKERKIDITTLPRDEAVMTFGKWYDTVRSDLRGEFGIGLTPVGYLARMGTTGVLPKDVVDEMLVHRGVI